MKRLLAAVLCALALAGLASACGGDDGKEDGGAPGADEAAASDRPTVGPATANWTGRTAMKACVEDPSAQFTTQELVAKLQTPYTTAVALVSKLPANLVSPCPYDYPGGQILVDDAVNEFTYQIYVTSDSEPSAQVLEQWQPAGRDSATPVTFRLLVPVSYMDDLGALLRWFSTVIGPEPTAKK